MSTDHDSPNSTSDAPAPAPKPRRRRKYVPVVGPRLAKLLAVVFGLFALLVVNSAYLVGVRILEAVTGAVYQNWLYMVMFLVHLVLGLALVLPVVIFGITHMRKAWSRPNRRAVWVGLALWITSLLLIGTGIVLTRLEGVIVVKDPTIRSVAFWIHVITPVVAAWLFVLHRLAGKRIQWKVGRRWAAAAGVFAAIMLILQAQDPRRWNVEGPASGEQYFFPSLARTSTGDFIPERVLQNDRYCAECHEDSHETWAASVHRFSSFNNPPYLFSVRQTREFATMRDGTVQAARWCAGCHDPVVFFSGKFDDPDFDDVNDPTAHAGITCTVCHAITHVNSVKGNSDYTIEEPIHYPFAFSDSKALRWVNEQLVKAKPEFHKATFLKPLHTTPEFCGSCHKVHLPVELNGYKWLRGQNHYDAYHLSGVSGHGVASFYYPETAQQNCNGCHMELQRSEQFGAQDFDDSGELKVHDHQFPSANTAIPKLVGLEEWTIDRHREFNEGVMRVDLFGVREGGTVDGPLVAPLRPEVPQLAAGEPVLLEAVIRTLKMGHLFTQGTADSNEVWMDVTVRDLASGSVVGRSGGQDPDGVVDPWSHFVNIYMLDREGNRIDRRNAQDIFVPLYNHQIPPGAADVIHYLFDVPAGLEGPLEVTARLRYRKFDTTYMRHVYGPDYVNDLPVLELAEDRMVFPVAGGAPLPEEADVAPDIPEWQRWNDYGIGLLRKGGKSKGQLRQAEEAFARVEALGRPDGPLNLARVYLAQGTVRDLAVEALDRAASFDPPAPPWTVAWFSGLVDKQNGYLDEAIEKFESIVALDTEETRRRGFDFSEDYNLLVELGQTLFERAKQERGDARREVRDSYLARAEAQFHRALELDPENLPAHHNLYLIAQQTGDAEAAEKHLALSQRYRPDDNARDIVIAKHRRENPAADHAAEAIVLYDLQRSGAFELPERVADAASGSPASGSVRGASPESADAAATLATAVPSASPTTPADERSGAPR